MNTWILVIDDDDVTRKALADILERAGYGVDVRADAAFLEAAGLPRPYGVAVVDYHLPGSNGLMVAARLKDLQPDCRVVLISSELPPDLDLSPGPGVVDRFLAKPFSKDAILETVARLFPLK